jgi:signal transduction histidine kinase
MSVAEMKKAILEKVETLSDEQIAEVKLFIDSIDKRSAQEYDLLPHIESIVAERQTVLKKLAE